jgi:transcription initiation factor TFIIIB Brf1 subunit/transcription initiation factor TFIIB
MLKSEEVQLLILEWLHRMHMSDSIATHAMEIYEKELKNHLNSNTCVNNARILNISTYSIYLACKQLDYIVSIKQICDISGADIRHVWKLVKKHSAISMSIICPSDIIQKYSYYLGLSMQEKLKVCNHILLFKPFFTHSPKTVIAYSIYHHVRNKEIRKMTIKHICKVMDVSTSCIFRFKKTIKAHRMCVY